MKGKCTVTFCQKSSKLNSRPVYNFTVNKLLSGFDSTAVEKLWKKQATCYNRKMLYIFFKNPFKSTSFIDRTLNKAVTTLLKTALFFLRTQKGAHWQKKIGVHTILHSMQYAHCIASSTFPDQRQNLLYVYFHQPLKARPYPFIQILSWFYSDFIQIWKSG